MSNRAVDVALMLYCPGRSGSKCTRELYHVTGKDNRTSWCAEAKLTETPRKC